MRTGYSIYAVAGMILMSGIAEATPYRINLERLYAPGTIAATVEFDDSFLDPMVKISSMRDIGTHVWTSKFSELNNYYSTDSLRSVLPSTYGKALDWNSVSLRYEFSEGMQFQVLDLSNKRIVDWEQTQVASRSDGFRLAGELNNLLPISFRQTADWGTGISARLAAWQPIEASYQAFNSFLPTSPTPDANLFFSRGSELYHFFYDRQGGRVDCDQSPFVNACTASIAGSPVAPFSYAIDGPAENELRVLSVAVVPEPETYALLLAGIGLMSSVTRRRMRN